MNEQRRNFLSGLLALPVALAAKTKNFIGGAGDLNNDGFFAPARITALKPLRLNSEGFIAGMRGEISKAVKQEVEMPEGLVQAINELPNLEPDITSLIDCSSYSQKDTEEFYDPTDTYFYYCGTFGVEELPSLSVLIENHRKFKEEISNIIKWSKIQYGDV